MPHSASRIINHQRGNIRVYKTHSSCCQTNTNTKRTCQVRIRSAFDIDRSVGGIHRQPRSTIRQSRTRAIISEGHLCSNRPLFLATTLVVLASNSRVDVIVKIVTVLVTVTLVLRGRDPETRLPLKRLVLTREVNTVTTAGSVAATLGQSAGALGQLRGDGGVL
jgi:hypothetical protein